MTGDAKITIACSYRVGPATVTRIISETCQALWIVLNREGYLKAPSSPEEWDDITYILEKEC